MNLEKEQSDLAWIETGGKFSFTVPALPGQSEAANPGGWHKPDMFVNGIV